MSCYPKTFRIDPTTGVIFGASDRPGEGDVVCSIYGSQMPHTVMCRRQRADGTWEGRRFTPTEVKAGLAADWEGVPLW